MKTSLRKQKSRENDKQEDIALFWKELIKEYLYPSDVDVKEKKRTETELRELRNSVFAGFIVINTIFVAIVYVLTQINTYKNILSFEISCPVVDKTRADTILIEPIPITFTLVFGVTLMVQFFGMLYHRFSTFAHIIGATKIPNVFKKRQKQPGHENDSSGPKKEKEESMLSQYKKTGERSTPKPISEAEDEDIKGKDEDIDDDDYNDDRSTPKQEATDEAKGESKGENVHIEDETKSKPNMFKTSIRDISFLDSSFLDSLKRHEAVKETRSKSIDLAKKGKTDFSKTISYPAEYNRILKEDVDEQDA